MYKIINLLGLFTNPYNDKGWQVWRTGTNGRCYVGAFRTRAQARIAVSELRSADGDGALIALGRHISGTA